MNLPRCPYCGIVTEMNVGDSPPEQGQFAVCAGCAGMARFSSGCERLERVDVEQLSERQRRALESVQRQVVQHLGHGGVPPGHSYREAMLCETCWEAYEPGVLPAALEPSPWENCAFCEKLTRSGIYRRLLLPHRTVPPPRGLLS